jgi:hypothetical protein
MEQAYYDLAWGDISDRRWFLFMEGEKYKAVVLTTLVMGVAGKYTSFKIPLLSMEVLAPDPEILALTRDSVLHDAMAKKIGIQYTQCLYDFSAMPDEKKQVIYNPTFGINKEGYHTFLHR